MFNNIHEDNSNSYKKKGRTKYPKQYFSAFGEFMFSEVVKNFFHYQIF